MPKDSSSSRVIWHGPLNDQHELRVERTAEDEGLLFVAASGTGDLVLILGIPLPATTTFSEDDIATVKARAEQAIAELAAVRTEAPSFDEAWAVEARALEERSAAGPLDTFTVRFEYGATGEGFTTRLLVVQARTEDEALARYREHFHRDGDDDAWAYWRLGIDVQRGLHREWLQGPFESSWLDRIAAYPHHRVIAFEFHLNAS